MEAPFRVIDADGHVTESVSELFNLWYDRMPEEYQRLAPIFKRMRDHGASVPTIAHAHGKASSQQRFAPHTFRSEATNHPFPSSNRPFSRSVDFLDGHVIGRGRVR